MPGGELREERALEAGIAWLVRAQDATADAGFSLGYFPTEVAGGWFPSYPETTGYIIPSLLSYSSVSGNLAVRERALAAARWECDVQMPSGAVQGGPVCSAAEQRAAVFNTGMVLQGWSAAWRTSKESRMLEGACRAAQFLVDDLDGSGHLRTHGPFVSEARIKTYNVLCAWGLKLIGDDAGENAFSRAAERMGEAALSQQVTNGWFKDNDLVDPERPLTHTIGYTLQGLLELGVLCGRDDFIDAARRGLEPLIPKIRPDGFLPGRFNRHWGPAARYVCLTGSAQLAVVMYRLDRVTGEARYSHHADRLVSFLMALQRHDSEDPNVNGAIGGSYPLIGGYMTAGYPNWAVKYFVDALMLKQSRLVGGPRE